MTTPSQINPPRNSQQQRGAAIIIMTLILMLGLITLFTFRMDRRGPELDADRKTAMALAQAKEALLGWAATDGGNTANINPGRLPCPSDDKSGNSLGAACPNNVGRFPWKTLQTEELRDGAAEPLWFIVDPAFQPSSGLPNGASAIMNSSYATQISLTANGNAVVAVLFAPGSAIKVQNRADTGQPNSPSNDPINFLESYVNPIVTAPLSNDHLLTVTAKELFTVVTQRMARELSLTAYSSGTMGGTISSIPSKPAIWINNQWNNAVDGPPNNLTGPSGVSGSTITLKFLNCKITYIITGSGNVTRKPPMSSC